MEIDTESWSTDTADDLFDCLGWALKAGIWDGRPISWKEAPKFQSEIERKVLEILFSRDSSTPAFNEMAAQLAWMGSRQENRALLARDIQELRVSPDGLLLFAGLRKCGKFGKSLSHAWKHHKVEILIGASAFALGTAALLLIACSGGTGAGAVAALSGALLDGLNDDDPQKGTDRPPANSDLASRQPPPALPDLGIAPVEGAGAGNRFFADTPFPAPLKPVYLESGIVINDTYFSYDQLKGQDCRETFFSAISPDRNFSRDSEAPPPSASFVFSVASAPTPPPPAPNPVFPSWHPHGHSHLLGAMATGPFDEDRRSRIGGINGINTSVTEACDHLGYLQTFASEECIGWVYNQTHGVIEDLAEVFSLNYPGYSPNNAQVLKDTWGKFDEQNKDKPNAKYLQFCHSKGAIDVRNALMECPKELRDRVIVVAIAPGAVVPKKLCFNSFNYASKKDIVHFGELVLPGFFDSSECGTSKTMEMILEYRKELELLDPHPDATGIDHDFESPTFTDIIERRITNHLNRNGEYDGEDE